MDRSRVRARRVGPAMLLLAAAMVGGACVPWPPAQVIDQSFLAEQQTFSQRAQETTCDTVVTRLEVAQTFTAGRTGWLDQVSLVAVPYPSAAALLVEVRATDGGGLPLDAAIGQGSYTGPGSPDTSTFVELPLTEPAFVLAGVRYALVLRTASSETCDETDVRGWNFFGSGPDYDGGAAYQQGYIGPWGMPLGPADLFFRTWVRAL